jgi:hypothetical protein
MPAILATASTSPFLWPWLAINANVLARKDICFSRGFTRLQVHISNFRPRQNVLIG